MTSTKLSWLTYFYALIGIYATLFHSFFDFLLYSLIILCIIIPIIIHKLKLESFDKLVLLLMFYPCSFIALIILIGILIAGNLDYLYFSEEQYVKALVIFWVVFFTVYIVTLVFILFKYIGSQKRKTIVIYISILFILIVPDIFYTKFIYTMFFNLNSNIVYNGLESYYFAFSQHFLTPLSDIGIDMKDSLLSNNLGLIIIILHTLTIRFIDITILASLVNLLKEK